MRVGVDTVFLAPPYTGIPNYVVHLLTALASRADAPTREMHGFRTLNWHRADAKFLDDCRAVQSGPSAGGVGGLVTTVRRAVSRHPKLHALAAQSRSAYFRATIGSKRLDFFHAFMSRPPGETGRVSILPAIYDLSFIKFPQHHPESRVRWMSSVGNVARRAPLIHTISNSVRDEIIAEFGCRAEDVVVIEPGINELFLDGTVADTDVVSRLALTSGHYFLSVSTLEPRKNFKTLLAAYERLPRELRRAMPLVLVGTHGWGDTDMAEILNKLRDEGSLRLSGYVSDADLKSLYRHARTMFYASEYEGYGMPILEALALGCPVVVSNSSSMPEAAHGLGHLVAPLDVDAWTHELSRAAHASDTTDTARRAQLSTAVAHRTWAAAADKAAAMYQLMMARSDRPSS